MEKKDNFKLRVVLLAVIAIALCVTLLAVTTFALFTDSVTINNHINAGNLKITLVRNAHSYSILDDEGYLATTSEDSENVDVATLKNAFDLPDGALIVPGSKLSATFKISNKDTVAFKYTVTLLVKDSEGKTLTLPNDLLSQLTIKLTDSLGSSVLAKDATDLEVKGVKTLRAKNGANIDEETFTVEIEFKDLEDSVNNLAQGKSLSMDIVINAIQETTRPKA